MPEWLQTRSSTNALLTFSLATFIIGILAPFMTVSKFIVVNNTVSIIGGLEGLIYEENWFLFILIGGFSVCFPLIKLVVLFLLNNFHIEPLERFGHWVEKHGKWSMLDVFVAAVLVVTLKLGSLVDVTIHYGAYIFTLAVVTSMLAASSTINRLSDHTQ